MEIYKTIRNIATATFVATLPYICNDGCAYSPKKANAVETRQEVREKSQTSEKELLESILGK